METTSKMKKTTSIMETTSKMETTSTNKETASKNHNRVVVGGHPYPSLLHNFLILPITALNIVYLLFVKRNKQGDGKTYRVGQINVQGGSNKPTGGGGAEKHTIFWTQTKKTKPLTGS